MAAIRTGCSRDATTLVRLLSPKISCTVTVLFLKVGTWLDTKIAGRGEKDIIGMLLGLAADLLIPDVAGLVGP
jgi:hypothetical protein